MLLHKSRLDDKNKRREEIINVIKEVNKSVRLKVMIRVRTPYTFYDKI